MSMLLLYTAFSFLVELYIEKKIHNVYLKRFQRIYLLEDLIFNTIFFFYKHYKCLQTLQSFYKFLASFTNLLTSFTNFFFILFYAPRPHHPPQAMYLF